jgi:hypothetical protein
MIPAAETMVEPPLVYDIVVCLSCLRVHLDLNIIIITIIQVATLGKAFHSRGIYLEKTELTQIIHYTIFDMEEADHVE